MIAATGKGLMKRSAVDGNIRYPPTFEGVDDMSANKAISSGYNNPNAFVIYH